MTNLAICKKCRALTADTEDDIGEHRRKHQEQAADIERARKAASDAQSALERLQAIVRDYEKALDQREVPVEPEINLRVVDDDDLEDSADDQNDLDAIAGYVDDSDVDPDDEAAEPDLASVPPLGGTLYTPGTGPVMS
jgi:hypothetical protein